jgi:cysteine-rich repeat protein
MRSSASSLAATLVALALAGCSGGGSPIAICGDTVVGPGEKCDDGNAVTETCKYGQATCTVCNSVCQSVAGVAIFCGDGRTNGDEQCDDGNALTESCAYNEKSCMGCNASCKLAAGVTSVCGDGVLDKTNDEECDDGNTVVDACPDSKPCTVCNGFCRKTAGSGPRCGDGVVQAGIGETCDDGDLVVNTCPYGASSCMVCGSACSQVAGLTSKCGDGIVDVDSGETCDDANTVTEVCGYAMSCRICNATCRSVAVAGASCGDGTINTTEGEQCDDANTVTEGCAYGAASCMVCSASCQTVPGPTSVCGDSAVNLAFGETCDDGNTATEACTYGQASCAVCDSTCHSIAGAATRCGDNAVQSANGEQCDDGNSVTERCAYGAVSCSVCNATCQTVAGVTARCGDSVVDASSGEQCDDGNLTSNDGCEADCKWECGGVQGQAKAFKTTDGCFLYFSKKSSWYDAQTTCSGAGMELATITTGAINDFVYSMGDSDIWIGFNDLAQDGKYVWQSGRAVTYTKWNFGEPNGSVGENCAELLRGNTLWNDAACADQQTFVCADVTCGNGTLQANEECDDGNLVSGDTCQSNCTVCGNGVVNANFGEECDDGNTNPADACTNLCRFPVCGDGVVHAGELCDDGNKVAGDGCENDCTLICGKTDAGVSLRAAQINRGSCYLTLGGEANADVTQARCVTLGGHTVTINDDAEDEFVRTIGTAFFDTYHVGLNDKTVEGTYVWHSGQTSSVDYRYWAYDPSYDCHYAEGRAKMWQPYDCGQNAFAGVCELDLASCGNSTVNAPYEQCDDGNKITETCTYGQTTCNVCTRSCQLEARARFCGDSKVTDAEQCDDGNVDSTDGCNACARTTGYTCYGSPSVCVLTTSLITAGPGLNAAVPDDAYDLSESATSMKCISMPVVSKTDGGSDIIRGVFVTVGASAQSAGDLVLKLISPAGTKVTFLSLGGRLETLTDYQDFAGFGGGTLATTHPITFADGAARSAELIGINLSPSEAVCRDDAYCELDPNRGAHPGGKLSAFIGENAAGTWKLCAGDVQQGYTTTLDQVKLGIAR